MVSFSFKKLLLIHVPSDLRNGVTMIPKQRSLGQAKDPRKEVNGWEERQAKITRQTIFLT